MNKTKGLTYADDVFVKNLKELKTNGVKSQQARPKYKDGREANSIYLTQVFNTYDLEKGQFPITTLRPIHWKSAIKEILWIYQDQSNNIELLKNKYGVNYWDDWQVGDTSTIGNRYGYTVNKFSIIDKILKQLQENPFNRRSIVSLWDYSSFEETEGLFPCAYNVMFDVRHVEDKMLLDCTLTMRSNDVLVAHHINCIQYVALQMMIACHFGWEIGKFSILVNNYHIYDNQIEHLNELLRRSDAQMSTAPNSPQLRLKCPSGTNFYDIRIEDFEMLNYEPILPQLIFDLAI